MDDSLFKFLNKLRALVLQVIILSGSSLREIMRESGGVSGISDLEMALEVKTLLETRENLMLELDAIRSSLKTFMDQIQDRVDLGRDPLSEIESLHAEIVSIAQSIEKIDELLVSVL